MRHEPQNDRREQFRRDVMARDRNSCVLCNAPAVDAHHILERRLFGAHDANPGGYHVDNGAAVCARHHMLCEQTLISVADVRAAAGILKPCLPEHLYSDAVYDKWGNECLANGTRLKGELFFDDSVQKVLAQGQVLDCFVDKVKYPRTYHLPWSPGMHDDDRMLTDMSGFAGEEIVVSTKMDGENSTLYHASIGTHARSVDGRSHPSRDWLKQWWSGFAMDIPLGWRICVENLYARHSIAYPALPSYAMGFSIWNERNICQSWDETLMWFDLLGITPVPVLYRGPYDEKIIRQLAQQLDFARDEGYVMRVTKAFAYKDFRRHVGKFVRPGHVQTVKHWMAGQPIVANRLAQQPQSEAARADR